MKTSLKIAALLIIGCMFTTPLFSQKKATTTKKAPSSGGASLSDEKSKMLCKAWKVDTISEFGVDSRPTSKQAADGITFVADGSLFMTMEGVASTGKWTYGGARINTVTTSPDAKMSFKIISLADNRMVLEYQTPDLIRIQYVYKPKK